MIKVDKTLVTIPSILLDDNVNEDGEMKRAIKHFESTGYPPVDFKVYKDSSIKDALELIFHEKCAYCESKIKHSAPFHIEHWRPKKKVAEKKDHKGYYWLASEWGNLLLACPTCNSSHKKNQFPLANGSSYALKSSDDYKALEKPLLINPCENNPELYLTYTKQGAIRSGTDKGRKSIDVYGLSRSLLVGRRKKCANKVIQGLDEIIITLNDNAELINKYKVPITATAIENNRKRIKNIVRSLKSRVAPNAQYSGLSRYLIREYRKNHLSNKVFIQVTKFIDKI